MPSAAVQTDTDVAVDSEDTLTQTFTSPCWLPPASLTVPEIAPPPARAASIPTRGAPKVTATGVGVPVIGWLS